MRFLRTITLKQFLNNGENNPNILIDINSVPRPMRTDYYKRNDNVENRRALCGHCDGTGNQHFKHKRCRECGGSGRA